MKYIKRPVVVEAQPLNNYNIDSVLEWITRHGGRAQLVNGVLLINTLEGYMTAQIGDYVIKGVKNEFYPCKPDIFAMTYMEVDSEHN